MSTSVQPEPITLTAILSQTNRIINAHSRHFLALSLIFLLPISFLITIYPTLNPKTLLTSPNPYPHHPLLAPLIFSLFIATLFISAVGTISYSTFHGFYGRPVKLGSAIKSLIFSVAYLFFTVICGLFFVCLIVAVFGFSLVVSTLIVSCFGFNVEFGSAWFNWLMVMFGFCFCLVLIYLQVHCTLGCIVVVVESKWGFEALRRSGVLVKGMRLVSLLLLLFGCVTVVFPLWLNSLPLVKFEGGFDFWRSAGFVVQTVLSSSFVTLFMLICISANAVLYMYCKALHGELASEIAEEFARDYVSLPFDDEKVPHIVTVVQA